MTIDIDSRYHVGLDQAMVSISRLTAFIRRAFTRQRTERELNDEVDAYLDILAEREMARGLSREDARRAARIQFGGPEQVKERVREVRMGAALETTLRDFGYAWRVLGRSPAFALAAIVTLALGIGSVTMTFSVVHGVLLRPLPYPDAERVAEVAMNFSPQNMARGPMSMADFLDWRAHTRAFERAEAYASNLYILPFDDERESEMIAGANVTGGFFRALRARPALGRLIEEQDEKPGTAVVVISEGLWKRRYQSDPRVAGRIIRLNREFTIIGVAEPGFAYPPDAEMWASFDVQPPSRRGPFNFSGIGRLRPGATLDQAKAEMRVLAERIERDHPGNYSRLSFPIVTLRESMTGDVRPALLAMFAAVGALLLIAVVNVAAILLARAGARERELAIRASLGAGRGRLIRQMLTESLWLGVGGAAVGTLVAWAGVRSIAWLKPDRLPRLDDIKLDGPVLAFAIAVALVSAVMFGLYPALHGTRSTLNSALHEGARGATASRRRARAVLVAIQVALCTTLLAGAGLLLRTLLQLRQVDPGFRAAGLVQLWVNPVGPGSRNAEEIQQKYQEMLRRIRALPGVEAASAAITMPNAIDFTDNFRIEGQSKSEALQNPAVPLNWVDTDYFRTMGIPLKAGRWFDEKDTAKAAQVAVISETLARRYFPGQSPLGKRIAEGSSTPSREIVGVVGDVKYGGLERDWEPVYYFPSSQVGLVRWRYIVIRGSGDLLQLARAATREIQSVPGNTPVTRVMTVAQSMERSIQQPRQHALIVSFFATIALLLAAAGIYGVMAYSVSQRTREFGVRMAVGARRSDICGGVIREAVLITAAGVAAGILAALMLTRGVERFLFQVSFWDPVAYAGTAATLVLTAVAASLLPAWKAMRVDPAVTLRQE